MGPLQKSWILRLFPLEEGKTERSHWKNTKASGAKAPASCDHGRLPRKNLGRPIERGKGYHQYRFVFKKNNPLITLSQNRDLAKNDKSKKIKTLVPVRSYEFWEGGEGGSRSGGENRRDQ